MEASMSLAHFCDNHGPVNMFTTQKLSTARYECEISSSSSSSTSPTPTSMSSNSSSGASSDSLLSSAANQHHHHHSTRMTSGSSDASSSSSSSSSSMSSMTSRPCSRASTATTRGSSRRVKEPCASCVSIPPPPPTDDDAVDDVTEQPCGFVTREGRLTYASSRHPANPHKRHLIRQACVNSLSIEQCPQGEGAFLFGDRTNGYVLSYLFALRDAQARGGRRKYALLYVSMDKVFLVQAMPFITKCMRAVVSYLQKQSDLVHQRETSTTKIHQTTCPFAPSSTSGGSRICSIRARVFKQVASGQEQQQAKQQQHETARPLTHIAHNPHLYRYLHKAFAWILRSARERLKETVHHGKPLEDNIVEGEREECELPRDSDAQVPAEGEADPDVEFCSLRHMRKVLGAGTFRALLWHLLMGNQIIWRCELSAERISTSALHLLRTVLPRGCVKIKLNCRTYVNSYCANLLSLTPLTSPLPSHLTNSHHYLLVDVLPTSSACVTSHKLAHHEFRMTSGCQIPEKMPQLLTRLDATLASSCFSKKVVSQCLTYYKEQWINAAKVVYKFSRIDSRGQADVERLLYSVLGCQSESDVRLVKFWMTGLSHKFKLNLRQSAKNNSSKKS